MLWLLVALLSLAAAIALFLTVPVDVTFRVDVYGKPEFRVRLRWLFGLIDREFKRGKRKDGKARRTGKAEQAGRFFDILRTDGLLSQLRRLLKDVLSRIKVRELKGDFRVGLGNPVETAILYAAIGPASFLTGLSLPRGIKVSPAFYEKVFEGYLYGEARLRPIRLTVPLLRFAFSMPVLRLVKKLAQRKWRGKKSAPETP